MAERREVIYDFLRLCWEAVGNLHTSQWVFGQLRKQTAPKSVVVYGDQPMGTEIAEDIPDSSVRAFAPQDVFYTYDPVPGRGYPHKLWVALTNVSGKDVIAERPRWEKNVGDLDVTPLPDRQPWTPEGPLGGWQRDFWGKETPQPLHFGRDRTAKIWVEC